MLTIVRVPGTRPKYRPEKQCDLWVVIDSLSGDQLTFDADRGDDAEVVTRSPRVYGPDTFGACQAYVNGPDSTRDYLRRRLHCRLTRGCSTSDARLLGFRVPLIVGVIRPAILGTRASAFIIDEVE